MGGWVSALTPGWPRCLFHHPLLLFRSVDVPTADARSCLRLTLVPTGPARQAIVVEAVAEGSSVAAAGVQRGMALSAISDPVRRSEVWQLQVSEDGVGWGVGGRKHVPHGQDTPWLPAC